MAGRIETYLHSDAITVNKGGAMILVTAQSDFAARTTEFIAFCQRVVKFVYAADAETWEDVVAQYPQMEIDRYELQRLLRETITVSEIAILHV